MTSSPAITEDAFFNGRLRIRQFRDGYRFSIDAVLLADFVRPLVGKKVLELGTGCGVVSLLLAHHCPDAAFVGVEIQAALAGLATENAAINGFSGRVEIRREDLRTIRSTAGESLFDLVVVNPPYHRARSGRTNPDRQRALARHELLATLDDVVASAGRMLEKGGRFAMIYPAERLVDLIAAMRAKDIEPKHLRMVHSRLSEKARLVLAEGRKGGRPGLVTAPPLAVYDTDDAYTAEVALMFDGSSA
jgi:tRNA1(Val) A37 N6-methylase TrmN6